MSDWRKVINYFGNGGSAADAQHINAEFIGRFEKERRIITCNSTYTDTSILTAIANDYSYDDIFTRQIEGVELIMIFLLD